ncbi:Fatty-acid peroxygenase [Micromonospora sp. MW-13]|uniref:cytochrome P450 n=1 Tax=Micromonospora sp. MW-13 TaxID=2094022 RepID=UPI000E43FE6F|nr:cytochrome P450 [Micromonospora sp. MW-13]RGC66755.1 Fatty-acid peroxygenase [Micromonospora sp. MW-13]
MSTNRAPLLDNTLRLALEGYGWLPNRRRRAGSDVVHARLMGQPAVGLCGPEAARFFYDEKHIHRHGAIPEPAQATLFGHRAVHTLDGEIHRHRKAMFVSLLTPEGIAGLVDRTIREWDETAGSWTPRQRVELFAETSQVLTRAVCAWVGVPLDGHDVPALASDLVALVDGFATLGPRHWRARLARKRREDWLSRLVEDVRRGELAVEEGSVIDVVAGYREADGRLLDARVAAVELLNVIRPTVAVCWFVTFAAHALHRWPDVRDRLRGRATGYPEAFVHEVRRFYPFAPFVGGRAVKDLSWQGEPITAGSIVLLDLYGQNHSPHLWPDPYAFRPERFLDREIGQFDLVPQGGGDPRTGHRCPGETATVALLGALTPRLAAFDHDVPDQDLTISLTRIPARVASGFVFAVGQHSPSHAQPVPLP